MCAHTQTILPRDSGRWTVQQLRSSHCYFHSARGFVTPILAQMLDSLVRVSRRGKENHIVLSNWYACNSGEKRLSHQCFHTDRSNKTALATAPHSQASGEIWLNLHWFPSLPFQQFQVLFNSLFKVLCIFPSRYLYAIGLPPVFSFRWNLPPTLSCNPKQLDSFTFALKVGHTGVSPSKLPHSKGLNPTQWCKSIQTTTRHRKVQIHKVSYWRFSRPY